MAMLSLYFLMVNIGLVLAIVAIFIPKATRFTVILGFTGLVIAVLGLILLYASGNK